VQLLAHHDQCKMLKRLTWHCNPHTFKDAYLKRQRSADMTSKATTLLLCVHPTMIKSESAFCLW